MDKEGFYLQTKAFMSRYYFYLRGEYVNDQAEGKGTLKWTDGVMFKGIC